MRTLLALLILLSFHSGISMAQNDTQIYGYVEKTTLLDKNITVSAKLDTGAKSSSLSATDIVEFERDGVPYLRYTVHTKKGDYIFESEYVGKVNIKARAGETSTHATEHGPIKRPIVLIKVKLGEKVRALQVNLTNRKRFLYPLLLGRDALVDFNGMVNPALTFTLNHNGKKKE